jgi:hypothetical protein
MAVETLSDADNFHYWTDRVYELAGGVSGDVKEVCWANTGMPVSTLSPGYERPIIGAISSEIKDCTKWRTNFMVAQLAAASSTERISILAVTDPVNTLDRQCEMGLPVFPEIARSFNVETGTQRTAEKYQGFAVAIDSYGLVLYGENKVFGWGEVSYEDWGATADIHRFGTALKMLAEKFTDKESKLYRVPQARVATELTRLAGLQQLLVGEPAELAAV